MNDPVLLSLLTPREMSRADALTIASGTPGRVLMERAGQAVAETCLEQLEGGGGRVLILCGPGNNGGDGFVAARHLRAAGCAIHLCLLGKLDALRGDAAEAAAAWSGPVAAVPADIAGFDLIVDALFGAGLSRSLEGEAHALVERINAAGVPVVAVDIPSGVDGETGQVGSVCVNATATVSFFRAKPGHYLYPGAAKRGRLVMRDIGIAEEILEGIGSRAGLNQPAAWHSMYPWPTAEGHKYTRGHAVVLSGAASQTGAARLSARAALRVGAGLVTLASPRDALAVNAAHLTAIMLHAADGPDDLRGLLADPRKNAAVLGPGLGTGPATRDLVETALTGTSSHGGEMLPRACVLDADALTSFAEDARTLTAILARAVGPVVITPHVGEFGRLFEGRPEITDQPSKLGRARAAAAALGCVVLLKGPDTVVAEPSGRAWIAAADAPWLATAGSGDVLSGLIGGLLAQSMPAFEAANAAVWLHAEAARRFGPGLIAEDLPELLPAVLRDIFATHQAGSTSNQPRRPASA